MRPNDAVFFVALVVLVASTGCGGDTDSGPDPSPNRPADPTPTRGDVSPVVDFQDYMLGELPGPGILSRDPFDDGTPEPVVRREAPAVRPRIPAPQLRGIVRSTDRLVALFDHGSAGLGESVRGWKITSIDERSVTLQRNGRTVRRAL